MIFLELCWFWICLCQFYIVVLIDPHLQWIRLHLIFVQLVPGRFPKTETGLSSPEPGGSDEREMGPQQCNRSSRFHTCPPAILYSTSQHITVTFLFEATVRVSVLVRITVIECFCAFEQVDSTNQRCGHANLEYDGTFEDSQFKTSYCRLYWHTMTYEQRIWLYMIWLDFSHGEFNCKSWYLSDWCQGDFPRRRLDSPPPNAEAQMKGKWASMKMTQSQWF